MRASEVAARIRVPAELLLSLVGCRSKPAYSWPVRGRVLGRLAGRLLDRPAGAGSTGSPGPA
jgi:hypothetical protein